jgi:two-component system phosphate regulon response regulator PhoB
MSRKKILVVEDEKNISKLVKYNLDKAGYDCVVTSKGEEALKILEREPFDLAVLDIMLPGIDGLEVCKRIRADENLRTMPIIMLTAKGEEVDKVVGFELGADDYIVKPFSTRELILRVKAILKRGKEEEAVPNLLSAEKIVIDIEKHKVTVDKKKIDFTFLEFKLLITLIQRRGRVQSRERLLEDVWDLAADVTTRTVDTHVKRLRQKLGKSGKFIETIRGMGYKFREEE